MATPYNYDQNMTANTAQAPEIRLPRGAAPSYGGAGAPMQSYGGGGAQTRELTGGYRGFANGTDDPGGRGNGTTPAPSYGAQNQWQQGPAINMQPGNTPTKGPSGVNFGAGAPGYGQQQAPAYNQWSPSADFQNPDGSWHQNAQYGNGYSDIGRNNPPRQTSGESGPANGQVSPQWGATVGQPGAPGGQGGNPARNLAAPGRPDWNAFLPSQNIANYDDQGFVRRTSSLNNATLPFLNASQNAYQYQNDADEARRRFDMQYNQTGQQNSWQQAFSDRQQTQAEKQAFQAGDQWSQQFQHQNVQDDRNYGLSQQQMMNQNNQFNANLSNQANQFQQTYGLQAQNQAQQFGLQNQQMDLSRIQNSQQYGLQQSNMMLDKLKNSQQYGLQTRGADLADLQNSQQYGLQKDQFGLAQLQNTQNFGLANQQMDLSRLTQQQLAAYQTGQLGAQNRGLDLQDWNQRQQVDLSRAQMAQQVQMQQAQLQQARDASIMAATGRNQAPNAKWLRAT